MDAPQSPRHEDLIATGIATRIDIGGGGIVYIPAGYDYTALAVEAVSRTTAGKVLFIDRPARDGAIKREALKSPNSDVEVSGWKALLTGKTPRGFDAIIAADAHYAATPLGADVMKRLREANPEAAVIGFADSPSRPDRASFARAFSTGDQPAEIGRLPFQAAHDLDLVVPTRAVHSQDGSLLPRRPDGVFRFDWMTPHHDMPVADVILDLHEKHTDPGKTRTLFVVSDPADAVVLSKRLAKAYGGSVGLAIEPTSRAGALIEHGAKDNERAFADYQSGKRPSLVTTAKMLMSREPLAETQATILCRWNTGPETLMKILRHGSAPAEHKEDHVLIDPGVSVHNFLASHNQDPLFYSPVEFTQVETLPSLQRHQTASREETVRPPSFQTILKDLEVADTYLHEQNLHPAFQTKSPEEALRSRVSSGLRPAEMEAYVADTYNLEPFDGRPFHGMSREPLALSRDLDGETQQGIARRVQNVSGKALTAMADLTRDQLKKEPDSALARDLAEGLDLITAVLAHRRGRAPEAKQDLIIEEGRPPFVGALPDTRDPNAIMKEAQRRLSGMMGVEEGEVLPNPAENIELYRGTWRALSRTDAHVTDVYKAQTDPLLRAPAARIHNELAAAQMYMDHELAAAGLKKNTHKTIDIRDGRNVIGAMGPHEMPVRGDIKIHRDHKSGKVSSQLYTGSRWERLDILRVPDEARSAALREVDEAHVIQAVAKDLQDRGTLRIRKGPDGWQLPKRLAKESASQTPLAVTPGRGIFKDVPVEKEGKDAAKALSSFLATVLKRNNVLDPLTGQVASFLERSQQTGVVTQHPEEKEVVRQMAGLYATWQERVSEHKRENASLTGLRLRGSRAAPEVPGDDDAR